MPRKLTVYETSQGFFDLAIAAPTKKAALAAWGASPDLFRQGFAQESHDKAVIAAALAQPGVVLRRPVGTKKRFQEKGELPTAESLSEHFKRSGEAPHKKAPAPKAAKAGQPAERDTAEKMKRDADEKAERKAAAAFAKEERKREIQRKKDEAAAAKARDRRQAAVKTAKIALEAARHQHEEQIALIDKERAALEVRATAERARWKKLENRLEASLQKASR